MHALADLPSPIPPIQRLLPAENSLRPCPEESSWEILRQAYRNLPEEEKARIMRSTARRRFTDDTFESWLRAAGLLAGEVRREAVANRRLPGVCEKLDEAVLDPGHAGLLRAAIVNFLRDEEPELPEAMARWEERVARTAAGESPMPGMDRQRQDEARRLLENPRFRLVRAALELGFLREGPVPSPAAGEREGQHALHQCMQGEGRGAELAGHGEERETGRWSARELRSRWAAWQKDWEAWLGEVERWRGLLEEASGARLVPELQRLLEHSREMRWRCWEAGIRSWKDRAELEGQIGGLRETHSRWALGMVEYLRTWTAEHPLRRRRESALRKRDAALSELLALAESSEEQGENGGPREDAAGWFSWARKLDGEGFERLEAWGVRNGLESLVDLLAEDWTGGRARESVPEEIEEGEAFAAGGLAAEEQDRASVEACGRRAAVPVRRREDWTFTPVVPLTAVRPGTGARRSGAVSIASLRRAMEYVDAGRGPASSAA